MLVFGPSSLRSLNIYPKYYFCLYWLIYKFYSFREEKFYTVVHCAFFLLNHSLLFLLCLLCCLLKSNNVINVLYCLLFVITITSTVSKIVFSCFDGVGGQLLHILLQCYCDFHHQQRSISAFV